MTTETYQNFIYENLENVECMRTEILYWEAILQKRAFDDPWPEDIRKLINLFRMEIVKELELCQYYLNRIKETRNDEACNIQPSKDGRNAEEEGRKPGDTIKDTSGIEQEDMGVTQEETYDFGWANQ